MRIQTQSRHISKGAAFSFVEVLMAVLIGAIVFLTLYAGISSGFAVLQVARENLRATQIMQEKMETIRLYNWEQLTNNGFIPPNFTDTFYPGTSSVSGITYTGIVAISAAPITESYSNDMRQITVNVQWVSGQALRQREMSTFVTRSGLQNYIY